MCAGAYETEENRSDEDVTEYCDTGCSPGNSDDEQAPCAWVCPSLYECFEFAKAMWSMIAPQPTYGVNVRLDGMLPDRKTTSEQSSQVEAEPQ